MKRIIEKMMSIALLSIMIFLIAIVVVTANATYIASANGSERFIGYSDDVNDLEAITKNTTISDNTPSLTVLTHGIDDSAKTWGTLKDKLVFTRSSLIEKLAGNRENVVVYYAEMRKTENFDFTLSLLNYDDYDSLKKVTKLSAEDIHKHIIIVFNSSDSLAGLDRIYAELNYVIDKIIYDIQYLHISNPRINLIGDGIGGLVNMMYAINHPNNVADFFSIGTPFSGTTTYPLAKGIMEIIAANSNNQTDSNKDDQDTSGINILDSITNTINSQTVEDLLKFDLKNEWNQLIAQSNIQSYAIGSAMDLRYIEYVANQMLPLLSLPKTISNIKSLDDFIDIYKDNAFWFQQILGEKGQYLELLSVLSSLKKSKCMAGVLLSLSQAVINDDSPLLKIIDIPDDYLSIMRAIPTVVLSYAVIDKYLPFVKPMLNNLISQYGLDIDIDDLFDTNGFNLLDFLRNNPIKPIDTSLQIIEGFTIEDLLGDDESKLLGLITSVTDKIKIDDKLISDINKWTNLIFKLLEAEPDIRLVEIIKEIGDSEKVRIGLEIVKLFLSSEDQDLINFYVRKIVDPALNFIDNIKLKNENKYKDWFSDYDNQLVLLSNGLVDLDSQLAEGYNGFAPYVMLYSEFNNNIYQLATNLPIPLSAYLDSKKYDAVDFIVSNINYKDNLSDFRYIPYGNDGIMITGMNNSVIIEEKLDIPNEIDGKTVKSISNNAFNNFKYSNVKEITLPDTIVELGSYAFANCISLEKINIPNQVNNINEGLFYNCSNLEISIPENIITVGNFAFWNTGIKSINIPAVVCSIGDAAFSNCKNLVNITVEENNTFYYAMDDVLFDLLNNALVVFPIGKSVSDYCVNSEVVEIRPFAFFNNNLLSILMNDGLLTIGKYAFANSNSMSTVILNKALMTVDDNAFDGCKNLTNVIILSETTPVFGWGVFDNEENGRKICVPGFAKSKYLNLKVLNEYTNDIVSIASHIVFENEDFENLTVEYGQDISLPIPTRLGYNFGGWYYKNDVTKTCPQDSCWLEYNDTTLCAKWNIIDYQLNFDLIYDNAIMNNKPTSYTVEDSETLPIASCSGYTFKGWYDNPEYIGSNITKLNGKTGNLKLYACWEANSYQITFNLNAQDAKCDITKTTVKFGKTVKLPLPTRSGYYFDGWYRNSECKGNALFNKDVNWNIPSDTTLYAKWTLEEYKIKVTVYENNKAVIKWWNENGLSNQEVSIKYGVAVSFYSFFRNYFETTGYRQGYICDSFNSQVKEFNNGQWSKVPDLGDNNSTVVVTPVWVLETHSISFSGGGGEISKTLYEGNYGNTITYPTYKRKGYNFKGWKIINSPFISDANSPYYVGKMFNDKTLPDLTPKSVGAGNITLEAQWEIKTFTILFNSNGGSSHNKISVKFNEELTKLPVPTKLGYTFDGWYTDNGFKGKKYTNGVVWSEDANGVVAPTYTLYAKWVITTYTISFDSNGGPGVKSINYTIESATFELPITINDGMENIGWINTNKTTEVLTRIEKGRTGNLNLKARWLSSESIKINNSDYHLYNRQVLLDFSTLSTTIINSTYVIDSSVERIALKGVSTKTYTKLRFVIADRSTPLTMTLVNFKFTAPDDQNAIYAQDATSATLSKINGSYCMEISGNCELNLVSKGTCIIKGGTRTAYLFEDASNPAKFCSAIVCYELNILQENASTLYIYGGNGKNGVSSSVEAEGLDQSPRDGKNGGSAIWSCYVKINISNLHVYGGNGGNGAIGLIGSTGDSGNLDHPNGYEGGIGQTGGNGGSGRYAFNVSRNITIDSTSKVYAYGGKGGNGGTGGTGGTGGVGRNGDVKKLKPGTGGTGGTGGKGGNKGTGYNAINHTPTISGSFSINNQGTDGVAGLGGNGGAGGRGGKKAVGNKYGSSGSTGAQGESGT